MDIELSGFFTLPSTSDQLFGLDNHNRTWQQAYTQIGVLAALWRARNIQRLALYTTNTQDFAIVLLSCVISQVDVCIPASLTEDNQYWLTQTVDLLVCDDDTALQMITVPVCTIDHALNTSITAMDIKTTDFLNAIKLQLQTSGSSGHSKVVQKSWPQMLFEARTLLDLLRDQVAADSYLVLGSVSQQHLYGLSFRVVLSLLAGWSFGKEQLMYPESLLVHSRRSKQKVIWISSPTVLHALNAQHNWTEVAGNVALVVSAGGMLDSHCKKWLQTQLACPVLEIYGSTETGVVAYRQQQRHWQFVPTVSCQPQQDGLAITSLWCQPAQLLADHIIQHQTGFELMGRSDRIIKLADKRISLLQMEAHLHQHPWVGDVHIAKHPENQHLMAWVALNNDGIAYWLSDGRKAMIAHLKQHFQGWLDRVAWPRYWRFDTALPRNSQSKLLQQDVHAVLQQPITSPKVLTKHIVSADEFLLRAQVPLDLSYFNGHFDHFHLVPGVVQLKWVLAALEQHGWLTKVPPKQWENLKFQRFLRPNDSFTLYLKRDLTKGKITFQYVDGNSKISSGRLCIPAMEQIA